MDASLVVYFDSGDSLVVRHHHHLMSSFQFLEVLGNYKLITVLMLIESNVLETGVQVFDFE
jgi:hypothetical protein